MNFHAKGDDCDHADDAAQGPAGFEGGRHGATCSAASSLVPRLRGGNLQQSCTASGGLGTRKQRRIRAKRETNSLGFVLGKQALSSRPDRGQAKQLREQRSSRLCLPRSPSAPPSPHLSTPGPSTRRGDARTQAGEAGLGRVVPK